MKTWSYTELSKGVSFEARGADILPAQNETSKDNFVLATAIGSKKARSEFLIAPVLSEIRRRLNFQISLFSGTEFNVDPPQGLVGFCDFILSASHEQYFISTPVMTVIEAKNENIVGGLGQCAATMSSESSPNQLDIGLGNTSTLVAPVVNCFYPPEALRANGNTGRCTGNHWQPMKHIQGSV